MSNKNAGRLNVLTNDGWYEQTKHYDRHTGYQFGHYRRGDENLIVVYSGGFWSGIYTYGTRHIAVRAARWNDVFGLVHVELGKMAA